MPLLDNLDLEEAPGRRRRGSADIPLRGGAAAHIRGATGTLINPLAVF
jgi:hypothetical protein